MAINAGPGPGLGVYPLEEAVAGSDLSKPFPLTRSSSKQSIEGIDEWGDSVLFPGLLEICYHGSSFMSFLVVNGSSYGTVWDVDYQYDPTGLSFEQWYRQWIDMLVDKALPKLANERLLE